MPGSPPTSTTAPSTRPPPSTRSNSPMPVGHARFFAMADFSQRGDLRGVDLAGPAAAPRSRRRPTMRLPARLRSANSRHRRHRTVPATCRSRRRIRCRRRRSDWISCRWRLWPFANCTAWTMTHCSQCRPTTCDNRSAKHALRKPEHKKRPGRSPALRRRPWRASLSESVRASLPGGSRGAVPYAARALVCFFPTLFLTSRSRPKPRCGSGPRTAATA